MQTSGQLQCHRATERSLSRTLDTNTTMWLLPVIVLLLGLLEWSRADTLVQLHVNRPYNDVNEKFVSFAVRPEDLYDALDGKNRKAVTNMATLLGDAHIKFVGDFYFASNAPTRLRNPTKIIWKGFNRWTRAVNWTMIIPVPYAPDEWDSLHTLKILNTSYMVGITDCIWQLGTDFGTSRAKDYVQELRTLKLMTDTFKPYVDDWRIMGADISAGSSADETRRYVDTSKDLNSAFGWTQPANMLPKSSLGSFLYDSDPALRILQQQRVPLWLSLPEERSSERLVGDETTDALRWAQTLGDAASSGFDVVFKRMAVQDFERPNFSLYVTALFKKVMGSRVFPARPLNVFSPSNKLYTHCANAVSGGLAFMVVNTEDQPTTITVRSPSRLAGKEIWQYVLTSLDQRVQLNNVRLHLNSTLRPLIKENDASKQLQLITPSMSVGFWVLPDVNLEHCQFSEIEAEEEAPTSGDSSTEKRRSSRYSSADRLLQRLIEETAVARGAVQRSFNRNRRFVLDEGERPRNLLDRLMQTLRDTKPAKREALDSAIKSSHQSVNVPQALAWLNQVFEQAQGVNRRSRRSASSYSGPYFYNRNGKKTAMTKKITEIRKPETKKKPLFDFDEFDEEKFFKKLGEQPEEPPAYTRLPDGDVHLKHIESIDGEENEPETEVVIPKKRKSKSKSQLKIIQREEEPEHDPEPEPSEGRRKLRLLPTEFFEALPAPKANKRLNLGATLNSLLFPEPFSSKATIAKNNSEKPKPVEEPEEDVEPVPTARRRHSRTGHVASDFLQAQQELGKHFLSHINEHEHEFSLGDETLRESSLEAVSAAKKSSSPDYFGAKESAPAPAPVQPKKTDVGITSWWDLPAMRRRRAIPMSNSLDEIRSNSIDKEDRDETMPLGGYTLYEYKVDQRPQINPMRRYEGSEDSTIMKISKTNAPPTEHRRISLADGIVTTVRAKVSRFINIVTQHMSEWYNTLTKHLDTDMEPPIRTLKENSIDK